MSCAFVMLLPKTNFFFLAIRGFIVRVQSPSCGREGKFEQIPGFVIRVFFSLTFTARISILAKTSLVEAC